jgi:3-deoxy-D-arabino-heptulosonate 7-phosphate (DAHP) synthase
MEFDASISTSIVFKNCTYGGVKITADNAASLKTGETTFFYNGVGSASFEQ